MKKALKQKREEKINSEVVRSVKVGGNKYQHHTANKNSQMIQIKREQEHE